MDKWSPEVLEEARQCRSQGMSDQQIADLLNNRQNVYHYTNSSIWGHLGTKIQQKQETPIQQQYQPLTDAEIDKDIDSYDKEYRYRRDERRFA